MATQETKVMEATDLVVLRNNQVLTTSVKVAEVFGKSHKDVLEKIRLLSAENSANQIQGFNPQFIQQEYIDSHNRTQNMFVMNRDGFVELVSNFSGQKAREWKRKYHAAFNQMEEQLKNNTKPLSPLEILKQQVQIMEEHEARISAVEQEQAKQVDINKKVDRHLEQHDTTFQDIQERLGNVENGRKNLTEDIKIAIDLLHYGTGDDYGHCYFMFYARVSAAAHHIPIYISSLVARQRKNLIKQGKSESYSKQKVTGITVINADPALQAAARQVILEINQEYGELA